MAGATITAAQANEIIQLLNANKRTAAYALEYELTGFTEYLYAAQTSSLTGH